jgi:hypothetical protein
MNSDLAVRGGQATTWSTWVAYAVVAGGVGLACSLLAYMLINGPEIRAAIESKRVLEIEKENQESCAKLGIPLGTEAFVTCATELIRIRQLHDERRSRDFDFQ